MKELKMADSSCHVMIMAGKIYIIQTIITKFFQTIANNQCVNMGVNQLHNSTVIFCSSPPVTNILNSINRLELNCFLIKISSTF